jgi:hypothetical protein
MAIQLPRRQAPQGRRQYAPQITRKNIKRVPNAADPGVRGGPNAAATPGAFGGGEGLETAGDKIHAFGVQWAKTLAAEEAQRNALLQESIINKINQQLKEMQTNPPTQVKKTHTKPSTQQGLPGGGGYQGQMTQGGDIANMGFWK